MERAHVFFESIDAFLTCSDSSLPIFAVQYGKTFRRKTTALTAIHRTIEHDVYDIDILRAAKRHTSNGLVMTWNQQRIPWTVARTWKATREFEVYLKRQKNLRRYCPVCHGVTDPHEPLPF